jgi:arylsulfatase
MIERWWTEAGRYDALPLDPRPIWQLVRPQLRGAPTSRSRFVYRPPLAHLPVDVSPPHGPRPFEIVAEVEITGDDTDGAIVNRGTINGGYALFVLEGHLVFDYNHFHRHTRVTSPQRVPSGRSTLGVRVDTQALDGPGQATLTVDGVDVASADIPRIARTLTSLGMDIGRAVAPVCEDYERPFRFPGAIHQVTFTLPDRRPPTPRELDDAARAELARQ